MTSAFRWNNHFRWLQPQHSSGNSQWNVNKHQFQWRTSHIWITTWIHWALLWLSCALFKLWQIAINTVRIFQACSLNTDCTLLLTAVGMALSVAKMTGWLRSIIVPVVVRLHRSTRHSLMLDVSYCYRCSKVVLLCSWMDLEHCGITDLSLSFLLQILSIKELIILITLMIIITSLPKVICVTRHDHRYHALNTALTAWYANMSVLSDIFSAGSSFLATLVSGCQTLLSLSDHCFISRLFGSSACWQLSKVSQQTRRFHSKVRSDGVHQWYCCWAYKSDISGIMWSIILTMSPSFGSWTGWCRCSSLLVITLCSASPLVQ